MQIRIPAESIKAMLDKAGCEISQESQEQIVAVKPTNNGRIHIRLKRYAARYSLKERHYWLADIHFEKGLRTRLFESKEVREFVKKHVKPFTKAEPKHESISLTLDGIRALELHKKENGWSTS